MMTVGCAVVYESVKGDEAVVDCVRPPGAKRMNDVSTQLI
jgi:hypothetical protein